MLLLQPEPVQIVLHHDDRNDDVTSDGVHEDDNTIAIIKQLVVLHQDTYNIIAIISSSGTVTPTLRRTPSLIVSLLLISESEPSKDQ